MPAETNNAITYAEVMKAMREVAKAWNCKLKFVMSLPVNDYSGKICDVWLQAETYLGNNKWGVTAGINRPWPANGHRTMTGLMLSLVYELDAAMQRRAEEEESAQRGQTRLRLF